MQKSVAYILKITEIKPFVYVLTLLNSEMVQIFFYIRKKDQPELSLEILQKIEFLWQLENGKKNIKCIESCLNVIDFIQFSIFKKMILQQIAALCMHFFGQENENSLGFFVFLDEKLNALRQTSNTENFWLYFLSELIIELGIKPEENSVFFNKKKLNQDDLELLNGINLFFSDQNFALKMKTFFDEKKIEKIEKLFLDYLSFHQDIYISKKIKNKILF